MKTTNRAIGGHQKTPKDENLADKQFWLEKIDSNSHYLHLVPKDMITQDMWEKAFITGRVYWYYLEFVPTDMITSRMCGAAVHSDYRAIKYVPEELRTEELFKAAIGKHFLKTEFSWHTEKDIENNLIAFLSWAPHKYRIGLLQEWERLYAENKNLNMRGKPNDIDIPAKAQQTFPKTHKWWEFWK